MQFFWQVLGALWYLLSFDRQTACWKRYCRDETDCHPWYIDCAVKPDPDWENNTSIFTSCDASEQSISFDYGMFEQLLSNKTPSQSFLKKYFYCLWWGLQNLRYDFI
jgi:cyclic nucleotide gated channel, plant